MPAIGSELGPGVFALKTLKRNGTPGQPDLPDKIAGYVIVAPPKLVGNQVVRGTETWYLVTNPGTTGNFVAWVAPDSAHTPVAYFFDFIGAAGDPETTNGEKYKVFAHSVDFPFTVP